MRFLQDLPTFLFFTGKGGVGKTSMACATAIHLADHGKRVLIVSTDPASNVGQVFGMDIGNCMKIISTVPGLSALEIDPQATAQAYREKIIGPVRGVLPESIIKSIEEQLSGACTTEIAAFDEFTAILTDPKLLQKFDHIVFDTAPTGHTIRMLQLPSAWSNFLTESEGDASCLGPLSGLEKQRSTYQNAVTILSDAKHTRMILVARAQSSSLREAARTHQELSLIGFSRQHLIINGVLPENETQHDELARSIWQREQAELRELPDVLATIPTDQILLRPFNLVGIPALRKLFAPQAQDVAQTKTLPTLLPPPGLSDLIDGLISEDHGQNHGLIMLMGKGGVGKTTLAAAIAIELASRGFPVHLTTSDPAAHLNETIEGGLENLTVSRIDPQLEIENYRQLILATKGKNLDEQGRHLLEEDLRSPCTEEIAVFNAFSRIIQQAEKKFVVMDTAPTGHTLLLLDATGAYHREMSRKINTHEKVVITAMQRLQDLQQTKILIVTLAETTPMLEAANLQSELFRAGIKPWAWIINNSLAMANPSSPLLQQRALNELTQMNTIITKHAPHYAVVPLKPEAPVGLVRLKALAHGQ